jgi:phosphatidate phosphatase APP1
MAQSGNGYGYGYGSGYGYGYGSSSGGSDPGQYAEREPGARRKKLAGFAKSVYQAGVATATEIRNQYDNTRIRGVVDVDDSSYQVSIPGSFPDVSIISKGDEQMVLFPSYAARHVRQFRDDDRQPSAYGEDERRERSSDLSEEDYWRNEWARMEDKKAVVDVDVRGWVYAPHKGPMTRKNRVLIGLARRLSGIPQQTHQPYGQSDSLRTGHEAREDAREQQKIDKEAEMIERRGQAEKEAAVKGGYSETPRDEDSEGEGPASSLRSRTTSGTATPMSGSPSPSLSARPSNNGAGVGGASAELTEAELAVANANLMARLGPFLTTPLVELPVTLFFYNDDQSVSRTVMTNDAGHFYIRAALDFVPTHVRVLANEKLSAVEPVEIIGDDGVSVISDIDDTIKKSSISMGAREIFRNTFIRDLKDLTIPGVKEWYGELHRMGVRFHYCSNSPWQLFPVIATFFRLAGLPPGSLHLKQYSGMLQGIFEPVAERKKGTLEKILRDFPRRRFILVGDSGEADLEVYTDLAVANPGRILAIFIRDVTTPEQTGYFDSAFNGPASAGPTNRQRPADAQAYSRKDSGSDHPDKRPALPSRTTAPAPRQAPPEEDLIDFSEEPQDMTSKQEQNLENSTTSPSPSTVSASQDTTPRKKPPPPRPNKPAALRGESSASTSVNTGSPNDDSGPPTLGKRPPPASQYKSATAHPLAQMHNSSAQSLRKSPSLPPRNPSTGNNSNAGSTKSNTNSSNAQSPSASHAASLTKQPPPPPPPRRRGTPSSINASPRQQALRRATSNSDIDSLNLDSPAAMSTPRPGPPNRAGTPSTFDSILGSTTGHTMQQGGQNMPYNKKLELWLRRLERAHEVLERNGVRLYTWRRGDDVVSEAVGIVKEATRDNRGADNAKR